MPIHIAVSDRFPVVLAGVEFVLSRFDTFAIMGSASNPAELETLLRTTRCDVLVTDYLLDIGTHSDGLSFLAGIRHRYPALQIVLFVAGDHPHLRRAAHKIGIRAIVKKSDEAEMLVEAVRAASRHVARATTSASEESPSRAALSSGPLRTDAPRS